MSYSRTYPEVTVAADPQRFGDKNQIELVIEAV
jgi:hypothetical protein